VKNFFAEKAVSRLAEREGKGKSKVETQVSRWAKNEKGNDGNTWAEENCEQKKRLY